MVTEAEVESARRDWEEGQRRLHELTRVSTHPETLLAQVEAVTSELRRRVGGTYSLRELAAVYARADDWSRQVVAESAPAADWPRTLSVVTAAAFLEYARGAQDYKP